MAEGSGGKFVEVRVEVEGDFILSAIVTQLNDLTTKISKVENICKSQGINVVPYGRVRTRSNKVKCIEDAL